MSDKINYYSASRITCKMRESLSPREYHQRVAVRKFSCAKISMFTVYRDIQPGEPIIMQAHTLNHIHFIDFNFENQFQDLFM